MRAPNFTTRTPTGKDRDRLVCKDCGFVVYENPKVIVGSVVEKDDKVLLCRRAIEPGKGLWTIPAGYLELNETLEDGACREAQEEAGARISIQGILEIFSIAELSQVLVFFQATLIEDRLAPGPESEEVRQFSWETIPWSEIAFPPVRWVLNRWLEKRGLICESDEAAGQFGDSFSQRAS